jgi:hypothetical protein
MAPRQYCADNLFLLGEMLDMATGYISLCDKVLDEETSRWSNWPTITSIL